jgi:hypothetical protein
MAAVVPRIVRSIDEEARAIGRCSASGADLRIRHEVVVPCAARSEDELAFECVRRAHRQELVFDIPEYFEPRSGVWRLLSALNRVVVSAFVDPDSPSA